MRYKLGVDLGGTHIGAGLVDANGNLLKKLYVPTPENRDFDETVKAIIKAVERLLEEYGANKKRLAEERQSLQEELDRVLTPAALPETISKEDFREEIKNINDILKNPEEPAEKKGDRKSVV